MGFCLQDLCFERKGFQLGPIDLEVPEGQRSVLLGPSGCGKTTLLRILAGLERPSAGSIRLGETLFCNDLHFLEAQKRRVGFVFQSTALWPHMTAIKQLRFAGKCSKRVAREWLDRVGLAGKDKRLPGQLSGGEAGRLALARALVQDPQLLLLDEPLRSVDPHLREDLQHTIRELTTQLGITTVIVTHDREEALALGENLAILRDGKLVEAGPVDDLFARPRTAFAARFLRDAKILPLTLDGTGFRSPFGAVPSPAGFDSGLDYALALGPMDLSIAEDGVPCQVIESVRTPAGWVATVSIDGAQIRVATSEAAEAGSSVGLVLAGSPPIVESEGSSAAGRVDS